MAILLLIAGLALLALAGDMLVRGAVSIAERLRIPPVIIGLTIVAFGTSAPELIVSLEAALAGAPGLAIGNVIGSNITNVTLVLGLPSVFVPLSMAERGVRTSLVFMIGVSFVLILAAHDLTIDRLSGALLISLFAVYLTYSALAVRRDRQPDAGAGDGKSLRLPLAAILAVVGLGGLAYGGRLTIDGALGIADTLGLANSAIGLTIVALGTSLPELVAGLAAAFHRQAGIAIGNVIGSNIFNVLGVLGLTALIVPLDVDPALIHTDMWIMLATSAALVPLAFTTRRIGRVTGLLLTFGYVAYVIVAIGQGVAQ